MTYLVTIGDEMERRRMLVIGDADVLIAFANPRHKLYEQVVKITQNLKDQNAHGLFPTTAICEALKVLQLERPDLAEFLVDQVGAGVIKIQPVDKDLVLEASKRFNPNGDPGDTFFDAVVAAIAIRYSADAIFGFDRWYNDIGLRLAKDLFP